MRNGLPTWTPGFGVHVGADPPRHADKVIAEMQVEDMKPLRVLGTKVYGRDEEPWGGECNNEHPSTPDESTEDKKQDIVNKEHVGMSGKQQLVPDEPLGATSCLHHKFVVHMQVFVDAAVRSSACLVVS